MNKSLRQVEAFVFHSLKKNMWLGYVGGGFCSVKNKKQNNNKKKT